MGSHRSQLEVLAVFALIRKMVVTISMRLKVLLKQNFVGFFPSEPLLIPLERGKSVYKILLQEANYHDADSYKR